MAYNETIVISDLTKDKIRLKNTVAKYQYNIEELEKRGEMSAEELELYEKKIKKYIKKSIKAKEYAKSYQFATYAIFAIVFMVIGFLCCHKSY